MATSDKESDIHYNIITKLHKRRAIVKGLFTKANRWTETNLCLPEVKSKLILLNEYWENYKSIQENIDDYTEQEDLQQEIDYRCEIEDIYLKLKSKLDMDVSTYTDTDYRTNTNEGPQNSHPTHSNQLTSIPSEAILPNVSFTPYNPDERFSNFIKRLDIYLQFKSKHIDPYMKVCILLNSLSPLIYQQLHDICAPTDPLTKDYDEIVQILSDFIDPKPSTWALQHRFINRTQNEGESVSSFSVELKKMTIDCDFFCDCGKSVAEMFLRLQFIRGLHDTDIRTKLLQERSKRPYNEIVDIASSIESAKSESVMVVHNSINLPSELLQVSNNNPGKPVTRTKRSPQKNDFTKQNGFESLRGLCYRCGSDRHRANKCKFLNTICHKCEKRGHLASVCMQNTKKLEFGHHQAENNETFENEQQPYEVNMVTNKLSDKFIISVNIEGKPVPMELDTGAALSTMSYQDFKKLQIVKRMFKTNVELRTYTGEIIKPKGVVFLKCIYKTQEFLGKLFIIDQQVDPIFGREWLREVKLDWAEIKCLKSNHTLQLDNLLSEFTDVFSEGIGLIPDDLGRLRLAEGAHPIFIKPRQVPYALREKVEKELRRLEANGIIKKIEHSDWGTPIVPVVKRNGEVRICADYKVTVNKVIKEEKYPIPRIEDIFAQMNGGKVFCTLDISNAYLHMGMDEDSALMQTLSTHQGLYRVDRLMFGVKVAPSIWQRFMDKTLQGMRGVQCFFDDIIIQGKDSKELLERLNYVLNCLRTKKLKLNREKCKFFQEKIEYLGHIIDGNGLRKTDDKIRAICNSKRPENVNELRTFLGLANYYNKFIKDLATILSPLNKLLQKGVLYKWTNTCEESFNRIKQEITSNNILVHFNPELPLVLATDASPVGLGAVLSHRYKDGTERPISFASRTLTKCECKYSQIDKEATGIYWGLKKFFPYCYGRKFILVTDHKPLVSIFNPQKTLPSISATRIFNYAHFLSGFNYTIEYRNTKDHSNADYFSRFPIEQSPNELKDDTTIFQLHQLDTLLIDSQRIAQETSKDITMIPILNALKKGDSVEKLGYHDNELTLQDGCIFKGWKVIIPKSLQPHLLQELHIGHIGMTRMKALARSYCTWKNIEADIENMVRTCKQCCLKQNSPIKETNHPWQPPETPWERIHIDFAGPVGGNWFFIVVDAFTRWVEIIPTKNISSTWCTRELQKMFTNFGLPLTLVSDNGTQFTSITFKEFMKNHGVSHKTIAPYHPSSNGLAERTVQTVKKSLAAMDNEEGKVDTKLLKLLMQLRQAPNASGTSAYHLMFGRKVRTNLSLMHPKINTKGSTISMGGVYRSMKVNDRVQVRDYTCSKYKWSFGTILERESKLLYKVKMDNGCIWRRHIDQILKCQI